MQNNTRAAVFAAAKEQYLALGVDVEQVMAALESIPISVHCWQGDDVRGFDGASSLSGGIATTGSYPGRARTANELRQDLTMAFSLVPGAKKLNLHAMYAEQTEKMVDRDALTAKQFQNWMEWAKQSAVALDFNPSFFSHENAATGFTLASPDPSIRAFWIEHGRRCREIADVFAKEVNNGQPCVVNFWMPDGYKDVPADMTAPRERMVTALDAVFADASISPAVLDAVESKLFGLGVESYTVGSHELMYGYAVTRKKLYCLDAGHFHPTEVISDKIPACLQFVDKLLLHVSRGVRWDSDHVILLDNELERIAQAVVRGGYQNRVFFALDYFDASINRVAAWVVGIRNAQKALLKALLEPYAQLKEAEDIGDYTARLALAEEYRCLPFAAVWDEYLYRMGIPGADWLREVRRYERTVLSARS